MHIRSVRVADPQVEPITLPEAKAQCHVRHTQADDRLVRLIKSAREQAESRTRRALITQEWRQVQTPCAHESIPLQRWPVQEVLSVTVAGVPLVEEQYVAIAGDEACVEPTGNGWPAGEVVVHYQAGYGDAPGDVPASLVDWMLVQIADAYANPSAVVIGTITARLNFIDGLLNEYIVPR
ncbi:MAG: hypothetical protein CVV07_07360 [Gammaproteobacteria bacterium HGW-Gammaproteobacteria-11]|nr:MAG: hypothetical protein CVV07_07360 [Gammaproteobacteria bacterium HGW-Gammaproteobacteria-11]